MSFRVVKNSGRTFAQSIRGGLTVFTHGASRVSHTALGSALYAGKNLTIPFENREYTEVQPNDPSTADMDSRRAAIRAIPITRELSDGSTVREVRWFTITKGSHSRSSRSRTTPDWNGS